MRQLEGCIGAGSAASYVELGGHASRHAHRVELAGRQPPVCWGHAVYMPKLVVGHGAVFMFLQQNLPNMYIDLLAVL